MSTSSSQTSQLAQNLPGFDAAPVIANMEQGLLSSLATPIQQTLSELPLQQFKGSPEGPPANLAGMANQIDPHHLITPVINAFGALGTGQFSGIDPMQTFSGISNAFDGTSGSVRQALGAVQQDWQGESAAATNAKTHAVVANGAQVGTQANGLGDNLSTAASTVAQARQQIIDIIDAFHAKMTASDLSTPSGKAAALTAANQANTEATAVMEALQGDLGSLGSQVSAIGAPARVTQAPTAATSVIQGVTNYWMGPNGLPGAVSAVTSDPRMTPKSLAQNFMDLLFLPETVTSLDQEMNQTNATMAKTNTIMTGLGNTLTTTNQTMAKTNQTMAKTNQTMAKTNQELAPLPGALNNATIAMQQTDQALAPLPGALTTANGDMTTLNGNLVTSSGDMTKMDGTMVTADGDMTKLNGNLVTSSGDMTKMDATMGNTDGDITKMDKTLTPISHAASDATNAGNDVKKFAKSLIP